MGHMHSAEHVEEHQNDQDQPKDSDASARPPPLISVIATTAAERSPGEIRVAQRAAGT